MHLTPNVCVSRRNLRPHQKAPAVTSVEIIAVPSAMAPGTSLGDTYGSDPVGYIKTSEREAFAGAFAPGAFIYCLQ